MLTILTQKSRTHQPFGSGIVSIARVIACRTSGDGIRKSAGRFGKPAARFYQDAKRYNGSNAAWGFFGLAKEHANKLRVVAAIDAGSDLMLNPACP